MFLPKESTFIIAEAGVNHNGDRDLAFQLVDAAAKSGADAVKFQTFNAAQLVTQSAPKAIYQQMSTGAEETQQEMLSALQLDYQTHHELKSFSHEKGLVFLSTAFDSKSLAFLVNELELETLKIPSGEITNGPLLLEYARTGRDLILSTGMSTLNEVKEALSVLAYGFTSNQVPSTKSFTSAFESYEGQAALIEHLVLLHCTTQYPAPVDSVNLRAMEVMRDTFGLEMGYSDHTVGWVVSCAAVALGARVIEKHLTLDRTFPGPDHAASLEPGELGQMVRKIRMVEAALGHGEKAPQQVELENRDVARKSLVAGENIAKGQPFSKVNLSIKRPGTGRSPMEYWSLIGKLAESDYLDDELID
jgi:N-acetylneuraminate synthase